MPGMKNMEEIKAILKGFVAEVRGGKWLKKPEFWLTFAAYAIPLSFLLYVLYWNFLPFGYNKTFTIDVGAEGDTSGEFYIEPSRDLSERKVAPDGTTFRELNGIAYAVFKPKAVLKNAEITVEVEGEGVSVIPPVIDFDPDSVQWDYSWDFTQGKKPEELGLTGNAFPFDGAMYFDGKSRLELPDSADKFETGPFTVYAEWTPTGSGSSSQQIIGHYNWEIYQNSNNVSFTIGRVNNVEGAFYSIDYPIKDESFFNSKHKAIASYSPANSLEENGYIELYIDGSLVDRVLIGQDKIWDLYNGETNLSIGKSRHGSANFFKGYVNKVNFSFGNKSLIRSQTKITLTEEKNSDSYFLISNKSSILNQVTLHIIKR